MLLSTLVIVSTLSYNVMFFFTQVPINLKLRASQFKVAKITSNILSHLGVGGGEACGCRGCRRQVLCMISAEDSPKVVPKVLSSLQSALLVRTLKKRKFMYLILEGKEGR